MGNYLLSVAGLSAAGSLFVYGDAGEPQTWGWLVLAVLACVMVARTFSRGVFAPSRATGRRSAPAR